LALRLIGVDLDGYRRFNSASCTIDGAVTAIVGPNEAGKSSLLAALSRTGDTNAIDRADMTRGRPLLSPGDSVVRLWYALEEEDTAALVDIPEANGASRLIVAKHADGSLHPTLYPPLERDRTKREAARAETERMADHPPHKDHEEVEAPLTALVSGLANDAETLSESDIGLIDAALQGFVDANLPAGKLGPTLEALREYERRPHPNDEAGQRLLARRPQILWFGDARPRSAKASSEGLLPEGCRGHQTCANWG
jgi:hypothetical protein